MLTGLPPYYVEDMQEMYMKIMSADLVFPSSFSDEVCDLLRQLLDRDVARRTAYADKIRCA
jgi:hypothetical protein